MGYRFLCPPQISTAACQVWCHQVQIGMQERFLTHHGLSLDLRVFRNGLPAVPVEHDDETVLLQFPAFQSGLGRQTGDAVAQAPRPKLTLHLDTLLKSPDSEIDSSRPLACSFPIRLIAGTDMDPLPTFVECADPAGDEQLQQELSHWGHCCEVYRFGPHPIAYCIPAGHSFAPGWHHFLFCHENVQDSQGAFLHSSPQTLSEVEMMKFLYQCGYWRATITERMELRPGLSRIHFVDVLVLSAPKPISSKALPPWPKPLTRPSAHGPFFAAPTLPTPTAAVLLPQVSIGDVQDFFGSGVDVLCRDPTGLDLPATIAQCMNLSSTTDLDAFDRIVIYTDGSSNAIHRHRPPLWNEEHAVLETHGLFSFWERPMPSLRARHIGSFIAEREAIAWAGLWRLSQNSSTDTLFRTDSFTTAAQALGTMGCSVLDDSFKIFRGVFHALESVLPGEALQVEHIHSHCNEPYNDFVDWLAKQERERSFYYPRQRVNMHRWGPVLPHFWILLSSHDGLPSYCINGLDLQPPALPAVQPPFPEQLHDPSSDAPARVDVHLSLGSANITSMYNGDWGHGGKLAFLRAQFKSYRLNLLGLQEARTPDGFGCSDHVLRYASGSLHGQYGVEFWVNTEVPYAHVAGSPQFFTAAHFQVIHQDPRLLCLRIQAPHLQCYVHVGHAPHSGHSHDLRAAWWEMLSGIVTKCIESGDHFFMLDGNADPGDADDLAVCLPGLKTTANTPLLRTFLDDHSLYLPCTTAIHVGDVTTWRSPDDTHEHCIDYIVLPQTSVDRCIHSCLLPDFDLGNNYTDHVAVAVQLQWTFTAECAPPRTAALHPGYDKSKIDSTAIATVLSQFSPPPWETDVETYVEVFNTHLRQTLPQICPLRKQAPKKPYIDDKAWAHREQKLLARRGLKELHQRKRRELLWIAFAAFRGQDVPQVTIERFWSYHIWLDCVCFRLKSQFYHHAHALRCHLRSLKHTHIKRVFDDLPDDAPASRILHELKQIIGSTNLKKLKTQPLPYVLDSTGEPCPTYAAAVDAWVDFFRQMEGGFRIDGSRQRADWLANLTALRQPDIHLALEELPPLSALEAAYRRVQPGKATGPDGIDGLLCHHGAASFARATFPLLLRLATHGQECLVHKGGRLQPLWKGKGPKNICHSYRSILISSHVGKSIHRCLRLHSADLFERFLQRQQFGGQRGISVTLGVHHARAYLRSRISQKKCVGLLFLDLSEAFYRIVRQLAIGGTLSDEVIAAMGQRLKLSTDLLHELYQHLDAEPAIVTAGLPPWQQNTMKALHSDTHFHVRDQPDVCQTHLGTRPGDCYADIVFSFIWARLLKSIEADLAPLGLLDQVPQHAGLLYPGSDEVDIVGEPMNYLGPTWMDDSCFCFAADSPSMLEHAAGQLCGLLLQRCEEFAMSPNFAPGKTELLAVFQGRHARDARKRYFGPSSPGSMTILSETCSRELRIVASYVHLGCTIHHQGDVRKEVRRRFCIAHQAFNQHRRLLFQNRALSVQRRAELFRTLILSKLLYGCESWVLHESRMKLYIHTSLIKLYRRLLPHSDLELSDDDILTRTGLPDPADLLRQCRLRHLGSLYSCTTQAAWGLLNADRQWVELIHCDLVWMWTQLHHASSLEHPHGHFPAWVDLMTHHRGYWKRLVRRAVDHSTLQRANRHRVQQAHRLILQSLQDHGQLHLPPPCAVRTFDDEIFACMQCGLRFASRGGCGAHMFRKHHVYNPVRRLFDTTQCGHCLREFHTFSKLKSHLLRQDTCRHHLIGRGHFVQPVSGAGSVCNSQQELRHDGLLPPLQAAGPHLPQAVPGQDMTYDLHLYEAICLAWMDVHSLSVGLQTVRDCVQAQPVTWQMCRATLLQLREDATDEEFVDFPLGVAEFQRVVDALLDPSAWNFLLPSERHGPGHWNHELSVLEDYCLAELDADADFVSPPIPRPGFCKTRYILHLFSGRRRCGDFQFYVEHLRHLHDDATVFVISVDFVINQDWGDISKQHVRSFWLQGIRSRYIVGVLGGPPCETWSQARARQLTKPSGERRGPRVVREAASPWALSSLSIRELRQVSIGNILMCFILEALVQIYCTGGVGLAEHPAAPAEEDAASIWRTPLVRLLLTFPECHLVTLAQGLWGAPSPKPTSLLLINAPEMTASLRKWQIATELPKGISIGVDTSGNWSTSKLKEYPPSMSGGHLFEHA
eukprot:s505_g4.t1